MKIKDDAINIITGRYKYFHRAWLFFLILIVYFFSPIPALGFSDDFNSYTGSYSIGTDFGSWHVGSGLWSFGSPSPDGTQYTTSTILAAGDINTITALTGSGNSYFEVTMNRQPLINNAYVAFYFLQNSSKKYGIEITNTLIEPAGNATTFTYTNQPYLADSWTRFVFDYTSSSGALRIRIYNATNGTLLNDQNIALGANAISADRISLTTYRPGGDSAKGFFDNVVASVISPNAASSISWGQSSYTVGDTLSFSWTISNTDWNCGFGCSSFIQISKNGVPYENVFSRIVLGTTQFSARENVPQTGSYYFNIPNTDYGKYRAVLAQCTLCDIWFGIGTSGLPVLDDDDTEVNAQSPAWLTAPLTVATSRPFTANYNFGVGGITTPEIEVVYQNNLIEFVTQLTTLPSGTINITVRQAGSYTLKLMDYYTGITYKSWVINAVLVAPIATQNITVSNISIDRTAYNWGDLIVGKFAIDNTNYSSGLTYIDIYNWDIAGVTKEDFDIGCNEGACQVGNFMEQIVAWTPATTFTPHQVFISGNNSARLMVKYSNGTSLRLAFANFTLNDVDSMGYMLKLNKNTVNEKEIFYATIKVPEYNDTLVIRDLVAKNTIYSVTLNYSTSSISKSLVISKAGAYEVALLNSIGNEVRAVPVTVVAMPIVPTPTATVPIPPSGGQAVSNLGDNLRNFMAMPAFWGLVITIFAFFAIGKTVPSAMGFGMFIVMNVEAVIGMYDPYKGYILAITWIFAGIYFALGRKVLTGG